MAQLLKLTALVRLPDGATGGNVRIEAPKAYIIEGKIAGGHDRGKAVLLPGPNPERWAALKALDGAGDLKVYGGEMGGDAPPAITVKITPVGANVDRVPITITGVPVDVDGDGTWDFESLNAGAAVILDPAEYQSILAGITTAKNSAQAAANAANAKVAEVDTAIAGARATVAGLVADTEQSRDEAMQQQQQNNVSAAALLGRLTAPSVAGIPATPGVYTITAGNDAGQVHERLAGGALERREFLEPASRVFAALIYSALNNAGRATLAAKPQAAGRQFANGNSWTWDAAGVANGGAGFGTCVEAAGGGYWHREFVGAPDMSWWPIVPDQIGATDNGAALNAMTLALGYRGRVQVGANFTVSIYTPWVIPHPFEVIGAGMNTSLFRAMDQSGDYIQVRSDEGVHFINLGIRPPNPGAKMVAGSTYISLRGSTPGTANGGSTFTGCSFLSHATAIRAISAYGYTITDNDFNDLQPNGVSIKIDNVVNSDYGDCVIERNNFHADPAAPNTRAIQHLAGGGIRIRNNKFYKHTYAYNMFLLHGAGTGIGFFDSNSVETQGQASVLLEYDRADPTAWGAGLSATEAITTVRPLVANGYVYRAATTGVTGATEPAWSTTQEAVVLDGSVKWITTPDVQYFAKLNIVGNQFNEDPVANILMDGGTKISIVSITGNQHTIAAGGTCVDLVSAGRVNVSGNEFTNGTGTKGGTGVRVGADVYFPDIGENAYFNLGVHVASAKTQALLDATPYGRTADLSASTAAPLVTGLIHNAESSIKGGGTDNPIQASAGLSAVTDLMTIRPAADGNAREGATYRDLALLADSGGRDALYVDLSGNRRMSRATFENLYLRSATRYAMTIFNEVTEADAFFSSRIVGGVFVGGLDIQGGGDSITIQGGTFTGGNESIRVRLITEPQTMGDTGDSSQLLIFGTNCTGDKGIFIERGPRPRIIGNNVEGGNGPGTAGALLYLQGASGDVITGGTITDNYLAASPNVKYAVRLDVTEGTVIERNSLAAPGGIAGSACIYITADSRNTVIGPNEYEGTPWVDEGVGTMGILKPLALAAGRTTLGYRAAPTFIKSADLTVALSGSLAGGAVTGDSTLAVLPGGFRPAATQAFSCYAVDDNGPRTAMVYVDTAGNVMLGQALTTTLNEISLGGISFSAPRV